MTSTTQIYCIGLIKQTGYFSPHSVQPSTSANTAATEIFSRDEEDSVTVQLSTYGDQVYHFYPCLVGKRLLKSICLTPPQMSRSLLVSECFHCVLVVLAKHIDGVESPAVDHWFPFVLDSVEC